MITFLKFFSLIFCVQKNYTQTAQALLATHVNPEPDLTEFGNPKSRPVLFNVEWLLDSLCAKNSSLFLDCLSSLKNADIEKYNSLNTSNYLHIFYLKNEIVSLADYKKLSDFAKEINKSTFYQIINSCKNDDLKNKLIYLENKVNLKSLKKRNKLQSFFQYINTSFQTPKDLEYERELISYEIKRFFSNNENKIAQSFDANQAQNFNVNYFGSFIKNLLHCRLPASTLVQMLSPIFIHERNLISFLSSLSLAEENITIFNCIDSKHNFSLESKFSQLKINSIGTVFLGDNYNFIYAPNTSINHNPGHALYLFDCPIVFSRIVLKSKEPASISSNLIRYVDSIRNTINPKFEEKISLFEAAALSFAIKNDVNNTSVSKI